MLFAIIVAASIQSMYTHSHTLRLNCISIYFIPVARSYLLTLKFLMSFFLNVFVLWAKFEQLYKRRILLYLLLNIIFLSCLQGYSLSWGSNNPIGMQVCFFYISLFCGFLNLKNYSIQYLSDGLMEEAHFKSQARIKPNLNKCPVSVVFC